MASAQAKQTTSKMLRSILLPEKKGLLIKHVPAVYAEMIGKRLSYEEFGFRSLEAYLRSIPDVVSMRKNPDGTLQCFGVADGSTAHIKSLVDRQKSNKKRRPRPKPMYRSRPRPSRGGRSGPVYRSAPSRPAAFPRHTTIHRQPPQRPPHIKPLGAIRPPPPPSKAPLSTKPSFGNHPQGFSNTSRNSYNAKPSEWGEPAKPNNSTKVIRPPPSAPANHTAPSVTRHAPSGAHTPPPGSRSAFVSVVATDIQRQQQQQVTSNQSKQSKSQQQQQQQPRVLAPRFLKQMQRELEEQKNKDQEKENQRKQHAQHLATEHNNNMQRVNYSDQKELRITVTNDLNQKQDEFDPCQVTPIDQWQNLRVTVAYKRRVTQDNNNDDRVFKIETSPTSPAREEWPMRRQVSQGAGDWRSTSTEQEESTVAPVRNIIITDAARSHSPASYDTTARSTPPPSPAPEDAPYCNWFKKEIDCKVSGLWRSSLETDFKKEFGSSLTDDIIQKMANLKIVTVEKVFNQEIIYPNLKIETRSSSSTSRTVVVNGSTNNQRHHSDNGSASPQTVTNYSAPQRSNSVSSDTSSTSNRTTPTITQSRQSPLPVQSRQSPLPAQSRQSPVMSPPPSSPSPTTMVKPRRDDSAPDYSHLAVTLPEEDDWQVYVSYIKNLQDFYVLIVANKYSDELFALEEEMGHYYKYSRRRLQGPPAKDCIYAAELNKEWLRVMVDKVHDKFVDCFLVDHGDTEKVEISKLQPLAPQFLHVAFQAIPCKLEGTEDDPENAEALQKFCELALGRVLFADAVSKEDAQVEVILYEEDAVATINDLCLLL